MGFLSRSRLCGALVTLVLATADGHAAIPDSERSALLDLYASANGSGWAGIANWNGPPGTECTWSRVVCDSTQSHVIELNLGDHGGYSWGLSGTVPASIRDLTHLEVLDFATNDLTGPMPDLDGWTSLRVVDFSDNAFVGTLPSLGHLPNLESADFSQNYAVSGTLPSFDGAPNLVTFRSHSTDLTGPIPSLAPLTRLSEFDVAGNSLDGSIPALGGLHDLWVFRVDGNNLTGTLPSLAGLTHLVYFDASFCRLTGSIPPFTNVPALRSFRVRYNGLTGSIPSLSSAPSLDLFEASNNALTGSLPPLANLADRAYFNAENNHLTGSIPALPASMLQLQLAGNELTGSLPAAAPGLTGGRSSLCPNRLDPEPDAAWDTAVDVFPWYANCNGNHLNFDQFGLTGSWYDRYVSGQGVLLASMPDFGGAGHGYLFGGWFTFPPQSSTSGATWSWYSFEGGVDTTMSSATLDLYETLGGSFAAPPAPVTRSIGEVTISLYDCHRGTMHTHFDDGRSPDYETDFYRVTQSATCTLDGTAPPAAGNSLLSGAWYDPATTGQGLLVDLAPTQNALFAAWYTFAPGAASGDPRVGQLWYSLQASNVAADATSIEGITIYMETEGAFMIPAQRPPIPIGFAQMSFEDCSTLTMSYQVFAPQSLAGTLHLKRLGPIPPGCE